MDSSNHHRVNSPKVIHEFFDDEVVIVNLDSGCYYSTDKSGFAIFKLLIGHSSTLEVIQSLARAYDIPEENISKPINEFVNQLTNEALIVPDGEDLPEEIQAPTQPPATSPSSLVRHFEAPVLNKYSDMKDLLLLDPIHDVDEKGWPIAKK